MTRGARLLSWCAVAAPLLLALAAGVAAAAPLLQPGFFEGHDGIAHLFRVAVLDEEIRRGNLYPRWAPDLALGFGYPVFHFYGPLSHYLAWLVSRSGPALPEAVKVVYGLALVASALGMYALVRAAVAPAGRWGAALAAAAYALAPYVLDDVYVRGAFGEAVSLATYPFLLWGVRRLVRDGSSRLGWLTTAGCAALAVATYNPLALFGLPLAGLYALWLAGPRALAVLGRVAAALLLGLGLSAWFWLPALVDQAAVTIGNLGYARENFLAPDQLVQRSLDYRHERFPFAVGLVQAVAAALGTVALLRLPVGARREAAFFPLAGLVVLFLTSTLAAPVWEVVPLLTLIAYPWRLLAFVGLLWAAPTGCLVLLVPPVVRPAVALAGTAALVWANLTVTLPEPIPLVATEITPAGWQRREQQLGRIGTTTGAEYLPRWSARGPGAASDVPRAEGNPSITAARLESVSGLDLALVITTTQPTTLRLHGFYFPGWEASIDGVPAPLRPETALGLTTLDLPAGTSRVELGFAPTPAVSAGWAIAAGSLAGLAGLLVWRRRWLAGAAGLIVLSAGLAALLARPAAAAPGAAGRELAPGIWLLGATADRDGEQVAVRLFWLASRPPERDYPVRLTLTDASGAPVAERIAPPRYGLEPTSEWRANEIIPDPVWLRLPPSRAAGRYVLSVALGDGAPAEIGTLSLSASAAPAPGPPVATFGGQIALDSFSISSRGQPVDGPLSPGDPLDLVLDWRALRVPDDDFVRFVHLYGEDGRRWLQIDSRPGGGVSAPAAWQAGDSLRDRLHGELPLDLPAGVYRLETGWYEPGGGARLATGSGSTHVLGRLVVTRPVAPPGRPSGARLGGWAQLDGWDRDPASGEVRLVWRAVASPPGRYQVFVHLVDEGGRIIAQSDSAPAGGAFPTDAWPLGVAIEDRRLLPALPGRLRVGLYDVLTGGRLAVEGGGDWVELGS